MARMTLLEAIEARCRKSGATKTEIAKDLGISLSHLSRLMHKGIVPRHDFQARLNEYLGVRIFDVETGPSIEKRLADIEKRLQVAGH